MSAFDEDMAAADAAIYEHFGDRANINRKSDGHVFEDAWVIVSQDVQLWDGGTSVTVTTIEYSVQDLGKLSREDEVAVQGGETYVLDRRIGSRGDNVTHVASKK